MNVSKTVCRVLLVLLWFQIIGKTIKTLDFHNNTYFLDQASLDVCHPAAYSEPCQTSTMECFAKAANNF